MTTERATTDSLPASMNPATRQRIDTSQCAPFHGRFSPACLSSTFRVARWSVPSSATFGSSSSTAQLLGLAQLRPSSAHRRHSASPHVGLPSAQPLRLNFAQARLGSPRHSSPHARPLRLASAQPRFGLPRLASTTQWLTLAQIATKVFLYSTCTYPQRQGCCSAAWIMTSSDSPDPHCSNSEHSCSSQDPSSCSPHHDTRTHLEFTARHATSPRQTLTLALQPLLIGTHIHFSDSLDFFDGSTVTPVARSQGVSNLDYFAVNCHRTLTSSTTAHRWICTSTHSSSLPAHHHRSIVRPAHWGGVLWWTVL